MRVSGCVAELHDAVEYIVEVKNSPRHTDSPLPAFRRWGAHCLVLVLEGGKPRYQQPRMQVLAKAGAKVFLCRGAKPTGVFHIKAAVVDRRYLYTGSANSTYHSEYNEELCFRMTGPVVGETLARLATQKNERKVWKGV